MAKAKEQARTFGGKTSKALWELNITELLGRSLEASPREEVNELLKDGWILLHIYTLKYREDGEWRERPMAILGKPASNKR